MMKLAETYQWLTPNLNDVPTDYQVRKNQLRAIIEQKIAALPPRMPELFEMSPKQFMTHKEITHELGTSEETVKKRVSGALNVVRVKVRIFVYLFQLFHL